MQILRQKVKDASPTFYQTLISMVAALAMGYLLSELKRDQLYGNELSLLYCLQVFVSFLTIVITWHEYAMNTTSLKWIIGYIDSIVPFLFGMTLFAIVTSLNPDAPEHWFYSLASFTAIGALAYNNQFQKARREDDNEDILKSLANYHLITIGASLICTNLFVTFGYICSTYIGNVKVHFYLVSITSIIFISYVVWGNWIWHRAISSSSVVPSGEE